MKMRESEILEFKKSTSELKEGIKSICAILNKHKKGKLIFGIGNKGEVLGQNVGEKTLREISQEISNSIEPKIFPKVYEDKIENKNCVAVEFEGLNVPYFAYGRAYIRVSDEDRLLSAKELERLILEKNKDFWERKLSEKKIKDANEEVLKSFIKISNDAKRINFNYTNVKSVLKKLNLIEKNNLLNAGEVLFCDENFVEVQAAVFAGKGKDTFIDIAKFKGNLIELISKSIFYIKEHMNWKAELSEKGREEIPEIPLRAIEEAVVNSLVHRDYSNFKGNEIAFFSDRIEIYNPGEFPDNLDPEDYIFNEERSVLRNPLIANTLYLGDYIEKWGSGLRRIYNLCKQSKIKVEFKKIKSGFLIIFWRNPFEEDGGKNRGKNRGKKYTQQERLDLILEKIRKGIFNERGFAQEIGVGKNTVRRDVEELKDKIEFIGSKKKGKWGIKNVFR